jgi:uncharacterized OB-fold protein
MKIEAPLSIFDLRVSELTRPFWDAARERRLLVQRCTKCGKTFFRPEIACPHCLSQNWTWIESSGRGTLYSFSLVHRPPTKAFKAPFIFAAVDVEEGWSMFSNLIDLEETEARIGMALQVAFHPLADGLHVPVFKPVAVTK